MEIDGNNLGDTTRSDDACCERNCYQFILTEDKIALQLILHSRYPSKLMKKQFILDYLLANTNDSISNTYFGIKGRNVCLKAWLIAYDLSESLYKKAYRLYNRGAVEVSVLPYRNKPQAKSMLAIGWMENFFQRTCEKAPNSGQWYLPCFMTKRMLYNVYKQIHDESIISHSQFCDLWTKYYKHVSIPAESRFSKCDLCSALREERLLTSSIEKREMLDQIRTKHNDLQMAERMAYYQRMECAVRNPSEFLSIIIDSMDQSKLLVPRISQQRKSTADAWMLRTHLIAAIVHGTTTAGAFDLFQFAHDSNLTCNFLLNILLHLKEIPKVLYLQLDNCWRENKNRFLIGFVAILIKSRVFHLANISFLMKGHTHEDIDQLFSQFSKDFLKNQNVLTLQDLMERWQNCTMRQKSSRLQPLIYETKAIFDIKSWLMPHLTDLHGHTGPHAFQISLDTSNEPTLKWKQWSSTDNAWQPMGDGIPIFKSQPTGFPQLVQPSFEKIDVPRVQQSINKMLNDASIRIFTEQHRIWWSEFWRNFPDVTTFPLAPTWPFEKLLSAAAQRDSLLLQVAGNAVSEDLQSLVQSTDEPDINVYVGNFANPSTREVIQVEDTILKVGQMVAIFQQTLYETCKSLPLIGEVVQLLSENNIHWVKVLMWQGSYSNKWRKPKKPHFEWISQDAIILYDFQLTKNNNRLHSATKKTLKDLYENYVNNELEF